MSGWGRSNQNFTPFLTPSAVQLQYYICGTQTLSSGNYYFTEITINEYSSQDGNRKLWERIETTFMEYDSTKCLVYKNEDLVESFERKNNRQTWVMYTDVNKSKKSIENSATS